jgi:hypothetical protein
MAWKRNVLVVANVTAASDDVIGALRALADKTPSHFTLLVPATPFGGGRDAASAALDEALERFKEAGLEADGTIGNSDACVAVSEEWDPKRYDEVVVCTLPLGSSKWLHAGLPERIGKITGAPVTHVVSRPHRPVPEAEHVERHREPVNPILAPFSALGHVEDREHEVSARVTEGRQPL